MLPCNARKTAAAVQHGSPRLHRLHQQKASGPAGGGPHGLPAFAVRLPALQKIAQGGVFFGIRFVFCQPAAQGKQLPLHHAHLGGIVLGQGIIQPPGQSRPPHGHAKQGKARQPQQQRTELPERFVPSARCRARKVQPVPFFSSGMPHGAPPAFRSLLSPQLYVCPPPARLWGRI